MLNNTYPCYSNKKIDVRKEIVHRYSPLKTQKDQWKAVLFHQNNNVFVFIKRYYSWGRLIPDFKKAYVSNGR